MARNLGIVLAYDGTQYQGWQVQPNGPTVQAEVESAIHKLTGERLRVYSASRTDSGVHALGQVANFTTESRIEAGQFRRGLQRFLPDDIRPVLCREVPDDFHATFSSVRKTYRYLLHDGPVLPPFLRHYVTVSRQALNVKAMQEAAVFLQGKHDFRCFETQWPNKSTSVRTIESASFHRLAPWDIWNNQTQYQPSDPRSHEAPLQPLICFTVTADGFLYNMVRAIIGTLLDVGTGRKPPDHMRHVIESQDRSLAGSTAPPTGLFLVEVDYGDALPPLRMTS